MGKSRAAYENASINSSIFRNLVSSIESDPNIGSVYIRYSPEPIQWSMVGLADRARSPAATRRSAENDYIVLINSDGMMMPVDEGSWLSGWRDLIGDPEYVPMTYEGNIAHELFHIADGHFGQTIFDEQAAVRFANSVREQLNQPQRATVMGSTIHNLRSNECFLPSTPF